ncbi:MAG TPA: FliM/FliN family flagellar motor switch protein [Bryobacteraceae bacterium]|nr:FliM/FliN family flagellar motor switch protein [Bryobacteraceae bacterium]
MAALEELGHLADIPMDVNVELDRTTMKVREILSLAKGSIIRMTRSAGENMDIVIGGARLGSGEIVIIEDTVGVRITDFQEDN